VGNGGSSGIISHSSIDFINACKLRAMPFTDNSILTCLANDYGYENVFSEGLKTLFTSKDILIAVSSSGSSKNIRNAAEKARELGGKVVTFSGFKSDNPLRSLGDYNFWLDSSNYGKVEIGHALLLHILTDEISRRRMHV
jgi:D-sedoheptulose 7-phosphate isomerase